ncbi:hypothetical protein B9Z55_021577 [Caenorhabditis nigoni]|uniref:F-box domain-containing protein n=1 Tax=Caenorhabditis nigoni TaxID=1611254 RepID=A0A2G5TSJ6_9PELO|nr:hypothetical protein B9Z55_021577 [Caenorhabditis nigoni]
MPINILSLPSKDLQYALDCMDIGDLVAFSLCSKRTKNLVESSNRQLYRFAVLVYENRIRFEMDVGTIETIYDRVFLDIFDFYIIRLGDRTQVWMRQEFNRSDWIAHLMNIFNDSMITFLSIENDSLSYLDTIKLFFSKMSHPSYQ